MAKRILCWLGIGFFLSMGFILAIYFRDMNRSYERINGQSIVIPSPYGDIEYTQGGSGPAVLVIHGSGGGYDQGELIAQAVLGDHFHWISPSRFGYLRSAIHEGATWDDQTHAYAYLLDHLGIKNVAVVAMSHGGPSALLFAALHPERVCSLTLISCGVVNSSTPDQVQADRKGKLLKAIFRYDLPYWAITKLFKNRFMGLMGASKAVVAGLSPLQREWAENIIEYMNPVSLRAAGVSFDNKATLPGERIAAIQAPTLIFHADDDMLQLYHNAEFAASTIAGARLIRFGRGGHLLMIVEQSTICAATQKHILDHMREEFKE